MQKELIGFRDDFTDNRNNWKTINEPEAYAAVEVKEYVMQNRSEKKGQFYVQTGINRQAKDWVLETVLKWSHKEALNHFGLVWGVEDTPDILNRFSLSADGRRASILCFENNHDRIYHRFNTADLNYIDCSLVRLTIFKRRPYYYFLINEQLIYICHVSHLGQTGDRFGYYIEPGLTVRSGWIRCQELEGKYPANQQIYDRLIAEY